MVGHAGIEQTERRHSCRQPDGDSHESAASAFRGIGLSHPGLADRVGMTLATVSMLKTARARPIRSSTLEAIRKALSCQPDDIFRFEPEQAACERPAVAIIGVAGADYAVSRVYAA
jgi:putative transcriptional regulator